jgi:hypothetical protein
MEIGPTRHNPARALSGMRVLVADSQANSRDALRERLACWQMKVDCAETSVLSLQMLRGAVGDGSPYQPAIVDRHLLDVEGESWQAHSQLYGCLATRAGRRWSSRRRRFGSTSESEAYPQPAHSRGGG